MLSFLTSTTLLDRQYLFQYLLLLSSDLPYYIVTREGVKLSHIILHFKILHCLCNKLSMILRILNMTYFCIFLSLNISSSFSSHILFVHSASGIPPLPDILLFLFPTSSHTIFLTIFKSNVWSNVQTCPYYKFFPAMTLPVALILVIFIYTVFYFSVIYVIIILLLLPPTRFWEIKIQKMYLFLAVFSVSGTGLAHYRQRKLLFIKLVVG